MSIPKYHEFYNIFLESLSDGEIHSFSDCRNYIKQKMNFTPEELAETITSGQSKFYNRVGWCKTHLKLAGLIAITSRGQYRISDLGKRLLNENIQITDELLMARFPEFAKIKKGKNFNEKTDIIIEETPQELFEKSYQEITAALSDELLTAD